MVYHFYTVYITFVQQTGLTIQREGGCICSMHIVS